MYHIGDWVVRSSDGLCKIADITNPDFVLDSKKMYYQLVSASDQNGKIYVPVESAQDMMRPEMSSVEANELILQIMNKLQKILEDAPKKIKESWIVSERERQNHYKKALQSNDPKQLIGIIKLIYQRKKARQAQGKKTTAVDGQYFNLAESRLYSELEHALGKSRTDVESMIKKICEKE